MLGWAFVLMRLLVFDTGILEAGFIRCDYRFWQASDKNLRALKTKQKFCMAGKIF
jgi:hypothetical protein